MGIADLQFHTHCVRYISVPLMKDAFAVAMVCCVPIPLSRKHNDPQANCMHVDVLQAKYKIWLSMVQIIEGVGNVHIPSSAARAHATPHSAMSHCTSAKVHAHMVAFNPCPQAFNTEEMALTHRSDSLSRWLSIAEFLPACVGEPRYLDV